MLKYFLHVAISFISVYTVYTTWF